MDLFFRGTQAFTLSLPHAEQFAEEQADVFEFEAYRRFEYLNKLQSDSNPAFTYVQVVAVSEVRCWLLRKGGFASVLVSSEKVRWVLCFPVIRRGSYYAPYYVPKTDTIPPDGDDVFFYFANSLFNRTPARAVPDLDSLSFLTPCPYAKLALIRAKDWEWDAGRNTVLIQPQDVAEIEIVLDSEVRVF